MDADSSCSTDNSKSANLRDHSPTNSQAPAKTDQTSTSHITNREDTEEQSIPSNLSPSSITPPKIKKRITPTLISGPPSHDIPTRNSSSIPSISAAPTNPYVYQTQLNLSEMQNLGHERQMQITMPPNIARHLQRINLQNKRKDPNAPKRDISAYMFYANDQRDRVRQENPALSFGQLGILLGEEWRALSAGQRSVYEEMAAKDLRRYEEELARYRG